MLSKTEIRVMEVFRKNMLKKYTIREMSRISKSNSYNLIFKTMKELQKKQVVHIEKKGNSNMCSVDIENYDAIKALAETEYNILSKAKIPDQNIKEIVDTIETTFFTVIITGSYAKQTQTRKSDIDIIIIVEDLQNTKKILNQIANKGELLIPQIHPYVFTKTQFFQMLLEKETNYGKLAFENHLIFIGAENYYLIIKEAIKNGFRG